MGGRSSQPLAGAQGSSSPSFVGTSPEDTNAAAFDYLIRVSMVWHGHNPRVILLRSTHYRGRRDVADEATAKPSLAITHNEKDNVLFTRTVI